MTTEHRIARIEKQNRRLTWGLATLCVCVGAAFVAGQAAPRDVSDVIRATKFQVVNEEGRGVVLLSAGERGGGALSIFNRQGKVLTSLGVDASGNAGAVVVKNREGWNIVRLGEIEGGSGSLTIYNDLGEKLVVLGAAKAEGVMHGTGVVTVHDPAGRTRRGTLTTRQ